MTVIGSPEQPAALLHPVEREAHAWLMRFATGDASHAELEAFKAWAASDTAHAEAFARACRLWDAFGPASEMLAATSKVNRVGIKPLVQRRAFIGGAMAASAAAATYLALRPPLGLWPSVAELAADYRTGIGEQRSISLAGGPSVELNTRTSIAFRSATDGTARIELIAGEAAITAQPDVGRAVEVIAADGRIRAMEALFNMRCEGKTVFTTCVTGAIQVEQRGRSVRLRAQEQVIYSPDGIGPVVSIDPEVVTAWKNGILVFHATPLAAAVVEINRYRSGRVILTNAALGRRLFNARFRIENIEGVFAQIQQVFGATVTTLPGGIVLLS
jgi:transmembrane sensor